MTKSKRNEVQSHSEASDSNEIRRLRSQIDKLNRDLAKAKSGETLIIEAVKDALSTPLDIYVPKLVSPKSKKQSEEIACLHISDTQIGKVTHSYHSEIANQRLYQLVQKTVKIANIRRSGAKIDEIRVYLGGDIVEGENIFPHQAHEIDQTVFEQSVRTAPLILARVIMYLVENFKKVKVYGVPGNHGRNGARFTSSSPKTNWDNVCYSTLKQILLGGPSSTTKASLSKRLEFVETDSFYIVDRVFDWGNLVVHGDQITGGFGGFPWYSAARKAWGWIDSIPEPWDYLWFGHFHTYAGPVTVNQRVFLANGTTESDNEYAQASLAAAGIPCQRLSFFDPEHGLISDNPIYLVDSRVPQISRYKKFFKP